MVATLSLDTITSSGSNITVDATKTFTVNGSLLSAGSTNILYKTTDHPIVEADVSGKSELIVTTTPASPRDITLPLVSVTGADTCIITVVVSLDATGTQSVRVMNGASEAWTGYQNGDFVKFCVSNGVWQVLDHKETYYSYFYVTAASTGVAPAALTKLTGWTEVTDIGNAWDNANNKIVTPTGMNGYWTIYFLLTKSVGTENDVTPQLYLDGVIVSQSCLVQDTVGAGMAGSVGLSGQYYATSTQDVEFYAQSQRNNAYGYHSWGGAVKGATHFVARFNRVY